MSEDLCEHVMSRCVCVCVCSRVRVPHVGWGQQHRPAHQHPWAVGQIWHI